MRVLEEELENKGLEVGKVLEEADRGMEEQLLEREANLQSMLKESQERLDAMRNLHQASQDRIFELQTEADQEKAGYRFGACVLIAISCSGDSVHWGQFKQIFSIITVNVLWF